MINSPHGIAGLGTDLSSEFFATLFAADAPEADVPLHLPRSAAAATRLTHNTDKPIGVNRISDLEGDVAESVWEFMDGR